MQLWVFQAIKVCFSCREFNIGLGFITLDASSLAWNIRTSLAGRNTAGTTLSLCPTPELRGYQ